MPQKAMKHYSVGELAHLDPTTIIIDPNIRTEVELDTEFVNSIKELGVLEPISAYQAEDGIHLILGQRRTLAAIKLGRPTIPVYITQDPGEGYRQARQIVENDRRATITDAERVEGYTQMALGGFTVAQISKTTGTEKLFVQRAVDAGKKPRARQALGEGLSLDHAIGFAEFEDNEDVLQKLSQTLEHDPNMFFHRLQQHRDQRDREALEAVVTADLVGKGVTVVASYGYDDPDNRRHYNLQHADGSQAEESDSNAVALRTHWDGRIEFIPVIAQWRENGFVAQSYGATSTSGPRTDEQKAERATLIANNKAMESATKIRKEFLKSLLAKKTPPKTYLQFLTKTLANHLYHLGNLEAGSSAAELLGITKNDSELLLKTINTTGARSEFVMLAMAFAAYERKWAKDCWRDEHHQRRFSPSAEATYLQYLVEWGYQASEVEQIILDKAQKTRK